MLTITNLCGFGAAAGAAPVPGILWWKCNDGSGSTITADVGSNGTITAPSSSPWATGKSGSGYSVANSGAIDVDIYSSSTIAPGTSKITVCAWVYWDSFATNERILFGWGTGYTGAHCFYMTPNGTASGNVDMLLTGTGGGGSGYLKCTASQFAATTWTHIGLVVDNSTSAGAFRLFYNGSEQSLTTATNTKSSTANIATDTFRLLSYYSNSALRGTGKVDDVRIYSGDVSSDLAAIAAEAY